MGVKVGKKIEEQKITYGTYINTLFFFLEAT